MSKSLFIPAINTIGQTLKEKITARETTRCLVSGLDKNEEYVFRILVFNKSDIFSYSNWVVITTTKDGGPVPIEVTLPNESNVTSNTFHIYWSESNSKFFNGYKIYRSTIPDQKIANMDLVETIVEQGTKDYIIKDLKPNTTYYFKVGIRNIMGRISESNMISIKTKN
jgi:hypothetical protein